MENKEKFELRKLQSRRAQLLKEKERLLNAIKEIDKKEEFALVKGVTATLRDSYYRKLPLGWLDSVYVTQIDTILHYITSTLSIPNIREAVTYATPTPYARQTKYQYYALLCESCTLTEKGMVLILRDPYRVVHTQPLETIDCDTANKLLGHILVVQAAIREDQENSNLLEICSIEKLNLTRNGIVKDGKEKVIPSYIAQEFAFHNKVIRPIDCVIERERIERQARKNGWCVYRIGATSAYSYFVKDNYWCALTQTENILELVIRPNANITPLDRSFMCGLEKNPEADAPINTIWKDIEHLQNAGQQCAHPTLQDV